MDVNYDTVRNMIRDKDCTLNQYMNRIIDEIDPHIKDNSTEPWI